MNMNGKTPRLIVLFYLWLSWLGLMYGLCFASPEFSPGIKPEQAPLVNKTGFIEIEPVDFYFHLGSYFTRFALTSSTARIWYNFQAADYNGQNKPLFVFFNGGPGSGTSPGLMSMYTSRWTLDNTKESGGDQFIPNPVSWTTMGNLLYIDARNTGFSYDLTDDPGNMDERRILFNAQNYNAFIDAADFLRTLLRFLDQHPQMRGNPVIIVGESYGGIRATVMLYLLLNYRGFANGTEYYQDEALVREIQEHYNEVFPAHRDTQVPAEIIARQFGHQILIQPAISRYFQRQVAAEMLEQDGSLIFQVAEELGVEYIPCRLQNNPACDPISNIYDFLYVYNRDPYIVAKPDGWLTGFFSNAGRLLGYTENLNQVTGMDAGQVPGLYASARANAYRVIDSDVVAYWSLETIEFDAQLDLLPMLSRRPAPAKEKISSLTPLENTFGSLQPWDFYYLDLNYDSNYAHAVNIARDRGFYAHYSDPHYGWMFLKNVAHVRTFITNAKYDIVVYCPSLPGALAHHTDIIDTSIHDSTPQPGDERPGRIILHYRPGAFWDIPALDTRIIRFPFYENSCHAVSITEPLALYYDIQAWLFEDL
jgi:hypothetical protein